MTTTPDSTTPAAPKTPVCLDCGHPPCGGCVDWCDTIIERVLCPQCGASFGDVQHLLREQTIVCLPGCGHRWKLSELPEGVRATELEPCCDGQCRWNMSDEDVAAWLASEPEPGEGEGSDADDDEPRCVASVSLSPPVALYHRQTLRARFTCNEGFVSRVDLDVLPDLEAPGAAALAVESARRHALVEGEERGRDLGFTTGFLAAQGLAQGLSEEEATAQALHAVDDAKALLGLRWMKKSRPWLAARNKAEILAKDDPEDAGDLEAADAPRMPCPVCGPPGYCRPIAEGSSTWECRGCGRRTERPPADDAGVIDMVRELDEDPIAWGYVSQSDVPLRQAYNEARVEINRLQTLPEQSPRHIRMRNWYRTKSGYWGAHFGRAAEDLDELDAAIAKQSFMPLAERDRLRRLLACVRNHLVEGHDEIEAEFADARKLHHESLRRNR